MNEINKGIRIFVSNRLGITSYQIPNPLFFPMMCGATYKSSQHEFSIPGDDSGDNISSKRDNYCEFTIQYWAWKNCDSSFIGLCHYHRFLSFSNKIYDENLEGMIHEFSLDDSSVKKYCLQNYDTIVKEVLNSDALVNRAIEVNKLPVPKKSASTVREFWESYDGVYFDKNLIDVLLQSIKIRTPKYYDAAVKYMEGNKHRGYNCYVMKKEFFKEMCDFQFVNLFNIEEKIEGLVDDYPRSIAYLGEILYGIYVFYLINQGKRVKELQLVYFEHSNNSCRRTFAYPLFLLKKNLEPFIYKIMPKASNQRLFLKKIYNMLAN